MIGLVNLKKKLITFLNTNLIDLFLKETLFLSYLEKIMLTLVLVPCILVSSIVNCQNLQIFLVGKSSRM